ncbi:uncharacterized protein LOC124202442 isoform X1 [Daphnia pulex]|uniref:uncharacterized protein LOC124202442 isoform X1 n=1 Tax=Daphnia pulex TaxID=6669 RepID=UPI001EDEBCBE|nr:uncharacterized protein LOC124202442 isoform X1 [Daphnia pulex]
MGSRRPNAARERSRVQNLRDVGTAGRPAQHQTLQTGRPPHGERLHRPSRPTGPGRRRRRRPAAAAAANEFQFKRRRHFPPRQEMANEGSTLRRTESFRFASATPTRRRSTDIIIQEVKLNELPT